MRSKIRHAQPGETVIDPADWLGADMMRRNDWLYKISVPELDHLSIMADQFLDRTKGNLNQLIDIKPDAFDLGPFSAKLEVVHHDLMNGRGFVILRGLPVDDWPRPKTAIIYWAMGAQLGQPISNNPQGDLIAHVTDLGLDYDHPEHRGYQTSAELNWHVDDCDVVTLLCMETAKTGGESRIASSIAVHNEILGRRPDLALELARPFYISRIGQIDPGETPYHMFPVFNYIDNYLVVLSATKHIKKGHELPGVPPLTDLQREALDFIQIIAKELHLSMVFQKGDIQLLNNYVNIHTRTNYEDWGEPGRRRHLWRLWLSVDGHRSLPPGAEAWRRGIRTSKTKDQIRLEI